MHNLEQKTARIDTLCREARILPVITIDREADILPMADALAAGGLTALEITLRTAHGLTAIRRLSEERPHLHIGAGTVLTPSQVEAVGLVTEEPVDFDDRAARPRLAASMFPSQSCFFRASWRPA